MLYYFVEFAGSFANIALLLLFIGRLFPKKEPVSKWFYVYVVLNTKFHESLAVVKDLETRMANNQTLRRYAASYKQYRPLAQKRNAAKSPATFEEQHRAELTAYRTAAAYLKANNITKLPSPNKLEAEYCALASEKAQFYEQYKEAKIELLKLKDAKQNVALFFREDERTQHHER